MINVKPVHNPPIDAVTYILYLDSTRECIVIDPFEVNSVIAVLEQLEKTPEWLMLTHEHYDHMGAVNQLVEKYHCKLAVSEACAEKLRDTRSNMSALYEILVKLHGVEAVNVCEDYVIEKADFTFSGNTVLHWEGIPFYLTETPGHSPGSICIQVEQMIFTGDTLLRDNPVITRLPGGNKKDYQSITRPFLEGLDAELKVYPGHGESFFLGEKNGGF